MSRVEKMWLIGTSKLDVTQNRLQVLAGAADDLDQHRSGGQVYHLRSGNGLVAAAQNALLLSARLDRSISSTLVNAGHRDRASDNERLRILGPGQLPQEARGSRACGIEPASRGDERAQRRCFVMILLLIEDYYDKKRAGDLQRIASAHPQQSILNHAALERAHY